MGSIYEDIVETYKATGSVKDTAEITGVSKVKVQRVLITEGLWSSRSSVRIGQCSEYGLTTEQIAKRLQISVKNVQAYLPYSRGDYGGLKTGDARRCKKYRDRMAACARLKKDMDESAFWQVVINFQDYPFYTDSGKRFQYALRGDDLIISFEEKQKSLAVSSLKEAFRKMTAREEETIIKEDIDQDALDDRTVISVLFHRWGLSDEAQGVDF